MLAAQVYNRQMLWPNLFGIWIVWVFWAVALIELVCFYVADPIVNKDMFRRPRAAFSGRSIFGKLRWMLQTCMYFLTSVMLLVSLSYIGLVLIWFLLGAVLNPEVYLAYASAAAALVAYSFGSHCVRL